jgi:signal transduction histidine kinase
LKLARSQLLAVFLAVTVVPAVIAGWLAWRLLEQDRVMAGERLREVRERRADDAAQTLSRSFTALLQEARSLPPGTVKGLGARLAYDPEPRQLPEASPALFAEAESAEFRAGSAGEAVDVYRRLAESPQPAVRAAALLRLGRILWKLGRRDEAIQAYRRLLRMENQAAGGAPAALAGQWAICKIAEAEGRSERGSEGEKLRSLLDSGRFSLDRSTYEIYAEDAARWSGKARPIVSEALADAAAALPSSHGSGMFRGQRITWVVGETRMLLLTPDYAARVLPGGPVRVRIATHAERYESLRRAEETGLPWTIAVALADPVKEQAAFGNRRTLLLWLIVFVAALALGGGYLGWRVIRRELALARMQSDLVAAVSHEFRTPLTSMRQALAALSEGRVHDEQRRQAYYQAQSRATDRLHRLVEALLDFGKIESGAMPYRMEPIDLAALTAGVAGDFEKEVSDQGYTIHVELPAGEVPVKGDSEALTRGLWNLLDNAVKYSGESRDVWVTLSRNGTGALLSVTDKGIGIPRAEHRDVFRKFYRGAASRETRIRGTGIGLAMVDHIVRSHGGHVPWTVRQAPEAHLQCTYRQRSRKQGAQNSCGGRRTRHRDVARR